MIQRREPSDHLTAGLALLYYAVRPDRLIALWMTWAEILSAGGQLFRHPAVRICGAAVVTLGKQLLLSGFLVVQTIPSRVQGLRPDVRAGTGRRRWASTQSDEIRARSA